MDDPQAAGEVALAACGAGLSGVTVAYGSSVTLDIPHLAAARGEILALIGPSGSGKTTALRAVAGFVRPRSGRIFAAGRDITDLPPRARGIGMVVQSYALFPHLSVAENVGFGLAVRRVPRPERAKRVAECLAMVGMEGFAARMPRALSGGQAQRVAIARALAIRPPLLLLDEPLSALDAQIRAQMIDEIARLHAALPDTTILYVTHDQTEAMTLAHRIAILRAGRIAGLGAPRALYRHPPNRFVAEFLGRANLLAVTVRGGAGGRTILDCAGTRLEVAGPPPPAGTPMLLCLRPHHLAPDAGGVNRLEGILREVRWLGTQQMLRVECGGTVLTASAPAAAALPPEGTTLLLGFAPEDATLLADDA